MIRRSSISVGKISDGRAAIFGSALLVGSLTLALVGCASHSRVSAGESPSVDSSERGSAPSFSQRLRGANNPSHALDVRDIEVLARFGANCLRINLKADDMLLDQNERAGFAVEPTPEDPLAPYRGNLARVRKILPACEKHGIGVIFCASNLYGRDIDVFWKKVDGEEVRDHVVEFWAAMARELKGEPAIIAYDILNEPNYKPGMGASWHEDLLPRSVAAIREVDLDIPLVVEPGPWGKPLGFEDMKPLDDPNIIYSFHHYAPHNYTHQGVREKRAHTKGKLVYPGDLQMFDTSPVMYWDKEQLRESMSAARKFQLEHDVPIFVGEFSVARWAPGRDQWLRDSIEIFEEYGWHWAYHSTAGWNGWNPFYPPEAEVGGPSNPDEFIYTGKRLAILKEFWGRNE